MKQKLQNEAKIIGKRLVFLRKYHDLTQSELANKVDTGQRAVSHWESGQTLIPTSCLIKLSRIFKCGLSYFDPDILGPEKHWESKEVKEEE